MIAITTSNSMSVNPRRKFLIGTDLKLDKMQNKFTKCKDRGKSGHDKKHFSGNAPK
jgi:hypothetical protein